MHRIRVELLRMIPDNYKGKLALLGGIQINTPQGVPDHFLVRDFETMVVGPDGNLILKSIKNHLGTQEDWVGVPPLK